MPAMATKGPWRSLNDRTIEGERGRGREGVKEIGEGSCRDQEGWWWPSKGHGGRRKTRIPSPPAPPPPPPHPDLGTRLPLDCPHFKSTEAEGVGLGLRPFESLRSLLTAIASLLLPPSLSFPLFSSPSMVQLSKGLDSLSRPPMATNNLFLSFQLRSLFLSFPRFLPVFQIGHLNRTNRPPIQFETS